MMEISLDISSLVGATVSVTGKSNMWQVADLLPIRRDFELTGDDLFVQEEVFLAFLQPESCPISESEMIVILFKQTEMSGMLLGEGKIKLYLNRKKDVVIFLKQSC